MSTAVVDAVARSLRPTDPPQSPLPLLVLATATVINAAPLTIDYHGTPVAEGVQRLTSYTPVAGDVVYVLDHGSSTLLVLGAVA